MSKFQARIAFSKPIERGYQLLPFKFIPLDDSRYVLVNMAGDFLTVDEPDLRALVDHSLSSGEATYRELRASDRDQRPGQHEPAHHGHGDDEPRVVRRRQNVVEQNPDDLGRREL